MNRIVGLVTCILKMQFLTGAIGQNFLIQGDGCVPQNPVLCYFIELRATYTKIGENHTLSLSNTWQTEPRRKVGVNGIMFRERVPPIGTCCTRLYSYTLHSVTIWCEGLTNGKILIN